MDWETASYYGYLKKGLGAGVSFCQLAHDVCVFWYHGYEVLQLLASSYLLLLTGSSVVVCSGVLQTGAMFAFAAAGGKRYTIDFLLCLRISMSTSISISTYGFISSPASVSQSSHPAFQSPPAVYRLFYMIYKYLPKVFNNVTSRYFVTILYNTKYGAVRTENSCYGVQVRITPYSVVESTYGSCHPCMIHAARAPSPLLALHVNFHGQLAGARHQISWATANNFTPYLTPYRLTEYLTLPDCPGGYSALGTPYCQPGLPGLAQRAFLLSVILILFQ
jgi:hypothetical protein